MTGLFSSSLQWLAGQSVLSFKWLKWVKAWSHRRGLSWAILQVWQGGDAFVSSIFPPRKDSYARPEVLALQQVLNKTLIARNHARAALNGLLRCFSTREGRASEKHAAATALCLALQPRAGAFFELGAAVDIGVRHILAAANRSITTLDELHSLRMAKLHMAEAPPPRQSISASSANIQMSVMADGSVWKKEIGKEEGKQLCKGHATTSSSIAFEATCPYLQLVCAPRPEGFVGSIPSLSELLEGTSVNVASGHAVLQIASPVGCAT